MEDWQKDFLAIVEKVTDGCFELLEDVGEVVDTVAESVNEAVEAVVEHWQNNGFAEIDRHLQNLFEPVVELYNEFEYVAFEELVEETEFPSNPKVEPTSKEHSACIGCRHYHGRIYGGNLLVCAMHPYGREDDNCPDWEKLTRDKYTSYI